MGWRADEIWFEVDVLWFRESREPSLLEENAPAFSGLSPAALAAGIPDGLAESRRRRADLRRRRSTRKARTVAAVIGPAVLVGLVSPRLGSASRAEVLVQDPPSATLRPTLESVRPARVPNAQPPADSASYPPVRWNRATSHGLPYAGRLSGGTQLPVEGAGWVTWNPAADRVPNHPERLYGNERVIRKLLAVIAAYRAANREAPRVVVGDISFRGGGPMELHRSHENGLDVDVYYPRLDAKLRPPTRDDQIDLVRAQDLLDRFLAVGVEKIFVGYSLGLRGPSDVVVPYPNHQDHLHVRFRP